MYVHVPLDIMTMVILFVLLTLVILAVLLVMELIIIIVSLVVLSVIDRHREINVFVPQVFMKIILPLAPVVT
jgi:hypothetical protein